MRQALLHDLAVNARATSWSGPRVDVSSNHALQEPDATIPPTARAGLILEFKLLRDDCALFLLLRRTSVPSSILDLHATNDTMRLGLDSILQA